MVAWDKGDVLWAAQFLQPREGGGELVFERNIGQVASNGHMVRPLRVQVVDQRGQDFGAIFLAAPQGPRQGAQEALIQKVYRPPDPDRCDVQV